MNYTPPSSTTVICTLYQGHEIVSTVDGAECQFTTANKDFTSVKEVPGFAANDRRIG